MNEFAVPRRAGRLVALAVCCCLLAACAVYTPPRPQLTGVVDPSTLPGGVRTAQWDLGAVRYAWQGVGINYLEAGLAPVLLIVHNHSGSTPVIYPQECYGIGPGGVAIAPYAVGQAAEVVFASTAYRKSAEAAVAGGPARPRGGAGGAPTMEAPVEDRHCLGAELSVDLVFLNDHRVFDLVKTHREVDLAQPVYRLEDRVRMRPGVPEPGVFFVFARRGDDRRALVPCPFEVIVGFLFPFLRIESHSLSALHADDPA